MPLRDHFHPPVLHECSWESFHSTWANALVLQLNGGLLPTGFRAFPQLHMGTHVAVDVATFRQPPSGNGKGEQTNGGAVATAVWSPPRPAAAEEVEFADRDTFEVAIIDTLQRRLVAAIELVSPGNKDRPATRRDFAIKCASYLQQQVSLMVIDVVTNRRDSLHEELGRLLDLSVAFRGAIASPLYAASYLPRRAENERCLLELFPADLALDEPLPTLPFWLGEDLALP